MPLCDEELFFIDTFVVLNRRARLRLELGAEKRRADCVWRFAHCARELLRSDAIDKVSMDHGMLTLGGSDIRKAWGEKNVSVMHFDSEWDRKKMCFSAALDAYLGHGPYILVAADHSIAFVETEPMYASHEFLLLKNTQN